ncbi:MAG TPA: tetratricopeptide repeat protein, partial [bacterium]|nr:tetratricopeptide repeat protein [bacterium]
RLIAIVPAHAGYQYNLALAYVGKQAYPEALAAIQQAIDLDATDVRYHFLAGKIHGWLGNKPEGITAYSRVLELEPDNYEALQALKRLE